MRVINLVIHNIRSTHNVGSILRSADGFGVNHVYLTGYTPYPEIENDDRLPHLRQKLAQQIKKTALGAENTVAWSHENNADELILKLKQDGFEIIALEQTAGSIPINNAVPT